MSLTSSWYVFNVTQMSVNKHIYWLALMLLRPISKLVNISHREMKIIHDDIFILGEQKANVNILQI